MSVALRPAEVCQRLLAALDASEGRRRRRKRNTTPDSIGMAIKRSILEETVRDDPDADAFEGWLLERCLSVGESGTRNDAGELFVASGPGARHGTGGPGRVAAGGGVRRVSKLAQRGGAIRRRGELWPLLKAAWLVLTLPNPLP